MLGVDLYVGYTCFVFLTIIVIVIVCGPELTASHAQTLPPPHHSHVHNFTLHFVYI